MADIIAEPDFNVKYLDKDSGEFVSYLNYHYKMLKTRSDALEYNGVTAYRSLRLPLALYNIFRINLVDVKALSFLFGIHFITDFEYYDEFLVNRSVRACKMTAFSIDELETGQQEIHFDRETQSDYITFGFNINSNLIDDLEPIQGAFTVEKIDDGIRIKFSIIPTTEFVFKDMIVDITGPGVAYDDVMALNADRAVAHITA